MGRAHRRRDDHMSIDIIDSDALRDKQLDQEGAPDSDLTRGSSFRTRKLLIINTDRRSIQT